MTLVHLRACLSAGLLLSLTISGVHAQAPKSPPPPAPKSPPAGTPQKPADAKPAPKPGALKEYKDVITAEAKSDPGLFTVHQVGDKYYYEIPAAALNKEMLWTTEIAQVPAGFGYGGTAIGDRVVRWTRRNNKIYLRNVSFDLRGGNGKSAIDRAVAAASLEPIIMGFDVETEGKDKSAVIEVSRLLISDVPEFSAKQALGGMGVDPSRSYIDHVKSFPTNIEVRSAFTYMLAGQRGSNNSATALIHYSMTLLPEKPMQGRYFDSRVGYFTESFQDYGSDENRMVPREYIARYRLEKKDPNAAVSEPVKQIVYYISREVPERWHPYIKKGIEDWQPAFEAAGFKNAIVCKEAPTEKEDPEWDPEDARYSVIRWAPMPIENAMGPHVHDPRSGEIISAHVIVWHDILKLVESWYFVQCAPLDIRAQKLPLPEPLMGELLRYVVAHEVGHTLGLRHNHKASSSYTIAQLRNKEFTEKYGDEASIMDYGRFNYVAQPGDNARLIPLIGPYDKFAIEWGYKPVPSATTPAAEKTALDQIAARQVSDPMLRFGGENAQAQVDPTVQMEDLSNDPVEATMWGLKNIDRVAGLIVPATTKYGEDYTILQQMYGSLLNQRMMELFHVTKLVGGEVETDYHAGRGNAVFTPVPKAKQAEAVKFLIDYGLSTPKSLVTPYILSRIEPNGAADLVLSLQRFVVGQLFSETRVKRLMDDQALYGNSAYTIVQLVTDVQNGVWKEIDGPAPVIDLYRRNLQRSYLQLLKPRLVGDGESQSDFRPIVRGALVRLLKKIDLALPKTKDAVTALHLQDSRKELDRILNPKI